MYKWDTRYKPSTRQWSGILDAVVKILKYEKRKIDHAIYIKTFSEKNISYLTVSTDDVLNSTNNETAFP